MTTEFMGIRKLCRILIGLYFMTLTSCFDFCTEQYTFEIPINVSPVKEQYKVGDTIHISMELDHTMVFDTSNKKHFDIPDFNPFLTCWLVNIDSLPIIDQISESNIIVDSTKYKSKIIRFSRMSNGIVAMKPLIFENKTSFKCSVILRNKGVHAMVFDSDITSFEDEIKFDGKCPDSFSDTYLNLLNDSNSNILSSMNKDVIDYYFKDVSGVKQRCAKYYFKVED